MFKKLIACVLALPFLAFADSEVILCSLTDMDKDTSISVLGVYYPSTFSSTVQLVVNYKKELVVRKITQNSIKDKSLVSLYSRTVEYDRFDDPYGTVIASNEYTVIAEKKYSAYKNVLGEFEKDDYDALFNYQVNRKTGRVIITEYRRIPSKFVPNQWKQFSQKIKNCNIS